MTPITLMFIVNVFLIIVVSFKLLQKKEFNPHLLESIKKVGGLAAAWGTFSTLVGLFMAFDALETSTDVIPFQVIMGGLKVALISMIYGLIIYCLSLLAYILLKFVGAKK
jgi:biopolymer transport protein ExbB/TolQ